MSIIGQAQLELERVNFGEGDSAVMLGILRTFFGQWDSGGAVSVASEVLARLIAGQPLTPLTGEPDEWHDPMGAGEICMIDGVLLSPPVGEATVLQNVRCSTVFKDPDGTCYDIGQPSAERVPVEFPYNPVTRRVEMPIYEVGGFEPIGDAAARVVDALTVGGGNGGKPD
jgi:hypothetical protein